MKVGKLGKFGEKPAYICGGRSMTYSELDRLSDEFAAGLVARGRRCALIFGHKEPEVPALMVACMKLGICYVPVDCSAPAERICEIVCDAGADVVVYTASAPAKLPEGLDCLSSKELSLYSQGISAEKGVYFEAGFEAPDAGIPAYEIFTSGSTGRPKGVRVPSRSLEHFAKWFYGLEAIKEGATVFCPAPFSFDLSVAPLVQMLAGGTYVGMKSENIFDFKLLFSALKNSEAGLLVATPSFAELCLCDSSFSAKLMPELGCIFFCGEVLKPATASKLFGRFPGIRILNAYGPTEAACAVCCSEITQEIAKQGALPVGDIESAAVSIELDKSQIIVLKGESVADGYSSGDCGGFIGEKEYATGDIGEIREGRLYFHGRADRQLKLKGYRIEPDEVENALCKIDGVISAAVSPLLSGGVVTALRAEVTCENGLSSDEIRSAVGERLPQYMIPKIINISKEISLNPNGKRSAKIYADS